MMICEADQRYLEHLVGTTLVHFEAFDGHGTSQIFTVAHVCESAVIVDTSDVCGLALEDVCGRYDPLGIADLGEKP